MLLYLLDLTIMHCLLFIHYRTTMNYFSPQLRFKYIWYVLTYWIFLIWYSSYPIFDLWALLHVGMWVLLIEPWQTLMASCCHIRQNIPGSSGTFPVSDLESALPRDVLIFIIIFWFNHYFKMLGPFESNSYFCAQL